LSKKLILIDSTKSIDEIHQTIYGHTMSLIEGGRRLEFESQNLSIERR